MVAPTGGSVLLNALRYGLLIAVLGGSGGVDEVRAQDRESIRFDVAPGVPVEATVRDEGGVEVRIGSAGAIQQVAGVADADGKARLDHEDVDFDGHLDLVVRASVGQVNEAVAVYRYDAASRRLQTLRVPSGTQANCDGLWSLTVDVSSRTLVSTCRGGPMWYTDLYRYAGDALYLYRVERMMMLETPALEAVLDVDVAEDAGPLAVWSTLAADGRVLEHAVAGGLAVPAHGVPLKGVTARVVASRQPLYAAPGDTSTRRYLVAGDRVELLDERDGWLQVRYRNPSRGPVLGWVSVALP